MTTTLRRLGLTAKQARGLLPSMRNLLVAVGALCRAWDDLPKSDSVARALVEAALKDVLAMHQLQVDRELALTVIKATLEEPRWTLLLDTLWPSRWKPGGP